MAGFLLTARKTIVKYHTLQKTYDPCDKVLAKGSSLALLSRCYNSYLVELRKRLSVGTHFIVE